METITVLSETSSVFNLQKLRISDQLLPASSHGQFASVTAGNDAVCYLCQIFLSKTLHPSFCNIDSSVCGFQETTDKKLYPRRTPVDCIHISNVNLLSVSNIKSVSVSVVFRTPPTTSKWERQRVKLSELVKNVLKLFVIKSDCVVFLDGITSLFGVDIHCLLIESIGNVSVGRVVSSTKVKINNLMSMVTFHQVHSAGEDITSLGGLEEPTKTLMELVKATGACRDEHRRPVYKQVLVLGPPGCGKTTLVHRVARDCRAVLKTVVGPELSSPLPGEAEKALTAIFEECKLLAQECKGGCILLLDQVDSLCVRLERVVEGHVVRLATQLCSLLETVNSTPGLMVVGTSSRAQALDPAVRRPGRFDQEIHIGVSSESERVSILRVVTRKYGLSDSVCDKVAKWTPGYVGADLTLLAASVGRRLDKLSLPLNYAEQEELLSCWHKCVCQLQPSALRGQLGVLRGDKGSFTELGGVDHVRRSLLQAIQWPLTHPEAFQRMGLPQPKGVLLYGPPGCAKTSLARAIAAATNTTFLAVSAAHIYSPYVGDAERTISELFHRARIGAPSILFIDEIDALVGCRGNREKGAQERILTAFLTEMDGVGVRLDSGTTQAGVVMVAATNRPDVLDPALMRPGRLDRLVYVGPPDTDQRLDILRTITKKMPLAIDVDLPWLAENTDLYSGADLSQLSKEAALCALTESGLTVKQTSHSHWVSALRGMKPSLSREQIQRYQNMDIFSS